MTNRTRKKELRVYLSEEEYILLNEKCAMAGCRDRSDFIRTLIKQSYVYSVDYSHIQRMNWLLANIANNINQVAKKDNQTGSVYADDIRILKENVNEIWQLQRSIQSKQP